MKNIVLIGMPGAGKSTIGVVLAKALGMQFVDTDLIIQQKTGKKLQEIINEDGTEAFLKTEEEVISSLDLKDFVIATGGSAVLSEKAMEKLKSNSLVIYLEVPISELKARLNNISTRGIAMAEGQDIESLYSKRKNYYEKYFDISVSAEACFEKTVENIIEKIKNSGFNS